MKKSDIALLVLIVSVSLVVSYFVGKTVIGTPEQKPTKVEVVQPISASFVAPSSQIFNDQAINPTQNITIGNSNTQSPFGDQ
jgi:hypothetical protein